MKTKQKSRAASATRISPLSISSVTGRQLGAQSSVTVHVPLTLHLRGGRKTVISPVPITPLPPSKPKFDNALIKAIVRAHRWRRMIENGDYASITELAKAEGVNQSYACRLFRLTLLAPDIVEEILNGTQPVEFCVGGTLRGFPMLWAQQRGAIGYPPDH
jgi:hypothetical protein